MQDVQSKREVENKIMKPEEIRRDSTKVYFFVVAILALVATNVYFYVKYKDTGDQVYELMDEKISMQAEIDRIEAELDRLSFEHVELNEQLGASRDSLHNTIADLRVQLAQNNITKEQLADAQHEINQLKQQVSAYTLEVNQLKTRNEALVRERDELRTTVSSSAKQVTALEVENSDLSDKVKLASKLKISAITVNGVRERGEDRESVESRARRVDKLTVGFTIADNPLAPQGMYPIYIRVIDPNGNLRTSGNGFFEVNGNQIQYTDKTAIEFLNDGASYGIDWRDQKGFQRGTYTILLYTDDVVMGQTSVVLK